MLELTSFFLVEVITLGFFPYHTQEGYDEFTTAEPGQSSTPAERTQISEQVTSEADHADEAHADDGRNRNSTESRRRYNGTGTQNGNAATAEQDGTRDGNAARAEPVGLDSKMLKDISTSTEALSVALPSIMTHVIVPQRHAWYDNACNIFDSAILRIPWFLRRKMFVVDRYHFIGNKFSNLFKGNVHRVLDADGSVAAEVINSVIDKCVSHISHLKGNYVLPFMKVLFAYLNGCAYVRDYIGRSDLEDGNLGQLFRSQFKCTFNCCTEDTFPVALGAVQVITMDDELLQLGALDGSAAPKSDEEQTSDEQHEDSVDGDDEAHIGDVNAPK